MTSAGVSQQKSEQVQAAGEVFDRTAALALVDGDSELLASLLDIFFIEYRPMMEAVRNAVKTSDPAKVEKTAHRLKGSVSIFCAEPAIHAALELEKIGRAGDLTNVAETVVQLEQQMASLEPALKQFRSQL